VRAPHTGTYGNLFTCHMHLNDALAISLKLAHVQSHALNMVSPSPFTSTGADQVLDRES